MSLNGTLCRRLAIIAYPTGDDVDSAEAAAALAALGHSLRVEVWRMLVPCGSLGLSAGVIAARLDVAPSSMSFHLQQMTHGRLLLRRRSSRQTIYTINDEVMRALLNFLGCGEIMELPPSG